MTRWRRASSSMNLAQTNPFGNQTTLQVPLFALVVAAAVVAGQFWTTSTIRNTGRLMELFGLRWTDLAQPRQWFRLFTSPYVQPEADVTLMVLIVALLIAEARLGTRLVATWFVLCDITSTLTILVALRIGAAFGPSWSATLHLRDGGMSSGSIGVAVLFLWRKRENVWSKRVIVLFAAWLIRSAFVDRELATNQHLASAVLAVAYLHFGKHDQN